MRNYNEPYRKLDKSWDLFESEMESTEEFLKNVHYDGLSQDSQYLEQLYPNHRYIFKEVPRANLFLLPNEFNLLSFDEILKPLSPPDMPKQMEQPKLKLNDNEYPTWYQQYIEGDVERRSKLVEKNNRLAELIDKRKMVFNELFSRLQVEFDDLSRKVKLKDVESLARLISISNLKHCIPPFFRHEFSVTIDQNSRIALIEFKFPDFSNEAILIGYTGKHSDKAKFATEAQKKKLVKQCLYSLIIRAAYLASQFTEYDLFETVVVNVEQDWFDPATGQPRNGLISSLQAPVEYLRTLDLSKLDPESCFKYLKGIMTPSLQNISPIRPIFVLNKDDVRFINRVDVNADLDPESNLAAMPWEDFEQLVAQLFEWEFSRNGVEVKVTRASRDRGVDAILFDPDPLKGGKFVLQAKRYTRTVDVSAVRDLYGTVMNEGANRGILITTSSYGPDSYEFAKDKPISLVDGQNLLVMLQKHGKRFRIDLEEARRLNNEF